MSDLQHHRPVMMPANAEWIELDGSPVGLLDVEPEAPEAAESEFTELDPSVRFESQDALRFGPRVYTPGQRAVIRQAVAERRPLRVAPLPVDGA